MPFGLDEFLAAGELDGVVFAAGELAGAAVAAGVGCCVAAGVGVAVGALSGVLCKTDREPLNDGSARTRAISMNAAAAPIVIFDRMLAVPRGPNAVLETLLENNAPASALPGCSRMTTIKTMHDRMNRPYKMYVTNFWVAPILLIALVVYFCSLYFDLCTLFR